jgi:hypothetical protein
MYNYGAAAPLIVPINYTLRIACSPTIPPSNSFLLALLSPLVSRVRHPTGARYPPVNVQRFALQP